MVKANHNPNWTYIPNHPYRILIIGGSGSDKTYVIELNKKATTIYFIKFIYTSKIHSNQSINCLLMQKKKKKDGIYMLKNRTTFIDYSQANDDVYWNLED